MHLSIPQGSCVMVKFQRGDTIIEVLLAVVIFGLATVSALALVNSATATSQRSLESTLVRQEIESQIELLKFTHNAYLASGGSSSYAPSEAWRDISAAADTRQASNFGVDSCVYGVRVGANTKERFLINPADGKKSTNMNVLNPETFAKVTIADDGSLVSEGIWVEAVKSPTPPSGQVGYIDFHVRACWSSMGLSSPMTLGTIVRLYEPKV